MFDLFSKNGVSMDRLMTLTEVVQRGSIAAAAAGDPSRQSLISRQIAELESALGIVLLDRRKKPYAPTAAAAGIAESCGRFVREVDEIAATTAKRPLPIRVGAGELVIRLLLVPWMGRERKYTHSHSWTIRNLKSSEIQEDLAAERMDIGLGAGLVERGPVGVRDVASYGMKLLLPDSIVPAKTGWNSLEKLPVVLLEGDGGFRQFLAGFEREMGIGIKVGAECTSYPQAVDLANAAGWAVFVPELWWAREKSWKQRTPKLPGLDEYRHTLRLGWNAQIAKRRPEVAKVVSGLLASVPKR